MQIHPRLEELSPCRQIGGLRAELTALGFEDEFDADEPLAILILRELGRGTAAAFAATSK